jgi:hypothetical protein
MQKVGIPTLDKVKTALIFGNNLFYTLVVYFKFISLKAKKDKKDICVLN